MLYYECGNFGGRNISWFIKNFIYKREIFVHGASVDHMATEKPYFLNGGRMEANRAAVLQYRHCHVVLNVHFKKVNFIIPTYSCFEETLGTLYLV